MDEIPPPPPPEPEHAVTGARQVLSHSVAAGLSPAATADEMVRAGFPADAVAQALRRHVERLDAGRESRLASERAARDAQLAREWLSRNSG